GAGNRRRQASDRGAPGPRAARRFSARQTALLSDGDPGAERELRAPDRADPVGAPVSKLRTAGPRLGGGPDHGMRESCDAVRQLYLDTRRLGAGDTLQMQGRPAQHLEPALKNAAGRANAGLVLIEALRRGVVTHADVQAVRPASAVPVVEQHEIEVAATGARA